MQSVRKSSEHFVNHQIVEEPSKRSNSARQFPNRYSALPDIGGYAEQQQQQQTLSGPQPVRYGDLEARLVATEASGRSLADEMVRLQSELLSVARRGDEALREERRARQSLESGLRTSTELLGQLERRLRDQEARLREERQALNSQLALPAPPTAAPSSSGVDDAAGAARVAALERDLEAMGRARSQLERIAFQLADELGALKRRLEAQGVDLTSTVADLRANTRRLEEACGARLETVQRRLERAGDPESHGRLARGQAEAGLAEMRDQLVEMRNRMEAEAEERRSVEQRAAARLSQLQAALGEAARRLAESLSGAEARRRERERQWEAERTALIVRLRDGVAEAAQTAAEREARLREETARLAAESEKATLAQQEARLAQERNARQEMDRRWEASRQEVAERLAELRTVGKADRASASESLRRLEELLASLDRRLVDSRREQSRALAEEVAARQAKATAAGRQLANLEEKISAATASLQQAVAGVSAQSRESAESAKRRTQQMLDELRKENERRLVDTDTQIGSLRKRLVELDERIEAKLSAAATTMSASLREAVDEFTAWQSQASAQLSELRLEQNNVNEESKAASSRLDEAAEAARQGVGAEVFGRVADTDRLRQELQELIDALPKEPTVGKKEMEECQASIRRLAEISQTVKSVLNAKLQAEQQQRAVDVKEAREELERLRALVAPLAELAFEPRLFVKPEDWRYGGDQEAAEAKADPINKWSLHTAVKWSRIKKHWMSQKYEAMRLREEQQRQQQQQPPQS